MMVAADGAVTASDVYRARCVRNHAKLAYDAVAAWLDGDGDGAAGGWPRAAGDRATSFACRTRGAGDERSCGTSAAPLTPGDDRGAGRVSTATRCADLRPDEKNPRARS